MDEKYYIARHNDDNILKYSSSGGGYTALTDAWFKMNGAKAVVYGSAMGADLKAHHIRANKREVRDRMRGSKYIQSDMKGVYQSIERDLAAGLFVCFSGTPCQVAAVKKYIKAKKIMVGNGQLFTIEVICHGVAESRFFEDYITNLEKKYKAKAISCNFRSKYRLNAKQSMEVVFKNGKRYRSPSTRYDWFYSVYLNNLVLKQGCYNCKFAIPERSADISIADYWGEDKRKEKAYSTIIVNSRLGYEVWLHARDEMTYQSVDEAEVYFPNMHHPTVKPNNYDKFWEIYNQKGYLFAQKYIGNNTFKAKFRFLLLKIVALFITKIKKWKK